MDNGRNSSGSDSARSRRPIFVSTGSTSADVFLAPALAELQRRGCIGRIVGMGGAPLAELGAELYIDTTPIASIGFAAGFRTMLSHAGRVGKAYQKAAEFFRKGRPALGVVVDNPGYNQRLLSLGRDHGVPMVYYIPPETWGMTRWQIRAIAGNSTVIASIFKPVADAYAAYGADVRFVGHPAVDLLSALPRRGELNGGEPNIGLFPGSRRHEVSEMLPVLWSAAEIILRGEPRARFIMCSANDMASEQIHRHAQRHPLAVEIVHRKSAEVLSRCDLLLTCSGSATLEAAIMGVPMVVMYRLPFLVDRLLQMLLVRNPYFSLPNYLTNRPIVPELRNAEVNPRAVADAGLSLLRDADRRRQMCAGLAQVREGLGPPGAVARTADLLEEMLGRSSRRAIS
jgi:lipid-A-disaccharide synthase